MKRFLSCAVVLVLACNAWAGVTTKFDDLSLPGPNSYWYGSDGSGGFTSGGVTFANSYDPVYGDWSGFAYSNVQDTTDSGWGNQFADITGNGLGSKGNYVVGYVGQNWYEAGCPTVPIVAILANPSVVSNIEVTNTTWAYLAMATGDSYPARQFGPSDWFKLTVTGINASGNATGSVNFYLAENGAIVDTWRDVNLSSLGVVSSLEFNVSSSDTDPLWGINTPSYFDLGAITTAPEPATLSLLCLGGLALSRRRKTSGGRHPCVDFYSQWWRRLPL